MNPTSCPICGAPQKHDHNYWRKFECGTQQKLSSKMRVVSEGCLWRVIEKQEEQIEAMNAKLKALAPHGTCGCSLDSPDDVCLHHSPKVASLSVWKEAVMHALAIDGDADIDNLQQTVQWIHDIRAEARKHEPN